MSNTDKLLSELKSSIVELANSNWNEFKDAVIKDGTSFLESIKYDIEKWTLQLTNGSLTPKDYEWLIKSKKDLVELKTLRDIGLAKARLDRISNDLLDTIVNKTISSIL